MQLTKLRSELAVVRPAIIPHSKYFLLECITYKNKYIYILMVVHIRIVANLY